MLRVLITGAAGNLGGFLAQSLLDGEHDLRLMIHQRSIGYDIEGHEVEVMRADLADPGSLYNICQDVDCIVHFAGELFQPWPERFLPTTNVKYVENLVEIFREIRPDVETDELPDVVEECCRRDLIGSGDTQGLGDRVRHARGGK